ncbi:MAG: hypothetical protein HQ581_25990, partial [Planctomycetes bacterium]|nr:hypothetical protein [Planctomycetota bacterium]
MLRILLSMVFVLGLMLNAASAEDAKKEAPKKPAAEACKAKPKADVAKKPCCPQAAAKRAAPPKPRPVSPEAAKQAAARKATAQRFAEATKNLPPAARRLAYAKMQAGQIKGRVMTAQRDLDRAKA